MGNTLKKIYNDVSDMCSRLYYGNNRITDNDWIALKEQFTCKNVDKHKVVHVRTKDGFYYRNDAFIPIR
jgi:hypothetical protein